MYSWKARCFENHCSSRAANGSHILLFVCSTLVKAMMLLLICVLCLMSGAWRLTCHVQRTHNQQSKLEENEGDSIFPVNKSHNFLFISWFQSFLFFSSIWTSIRCQILVGIQHPKPFLQLLRQYKPYPEIVHDPKPTEHERLIQWNAVGFFYQI